MKEAILFPVHTAVAEALSLIKN